MNHPKTTKLILLFGISMLLSSHCFLLANSDDSANTLTGFSTIQLELLGGPTSVCEGISLDLESIPIRDINDLELDSLNF